MAMYSCPKCDELAERVAWLESELRQQVGDTERDRLRAWMRRRAGGSSQLGLPVVLALYGARGRLMGNQMLMEAMPTRYGDADERGEALINSLVAFARRILGRDAILNSPGKGYRLSPDGMELVRSIMEGQTV